MSTPLSIVLPTKDRLALLQCTMESILPQLGDGDEILVLVDGPQDESYPFLQTLLGQGVRLIQPEGKLGGFSHYRLLFEAARHDHIVMVHDDELYHGDLLNNVRSAFASDNKVTFINTGQVVVWAGTKLVVQKNISFDHQRNHDGTLWASEEIQRGMRFNCSCLAFCRDSPSLNVLTRTQISADNLFAALVAAKGRVVELPFFGSTWLLHSGNTSRRDYLKPGHTALWQALEELKENGSLGFLSKTSIDAQRAFASRVYAWNAFAAAAPDGNFSGFEECVRQVHLAGGNSPAYFLLEAATLPGIWPVFVSLVRLAKKWTPLGRSSQRTGDTDPDQLVSLLALPDVLVDRWKTIAEKAGR